MRLSYFSSIIDDVAATFLNEKPRSLCLGRDLDAISLKSGFEYSKGVMGQRSKFRVFGHQYSAKTTVGNSVKADKTVARKQKAILTALNTLYVLMNIMLSLLSLNKIM